MSITVRAPEGEGKCAELMVLVIYGTTKRHEDHDEHDGFKVLDPYLLEYTPRYLIVDHKLFIYKVN